MNRFARITLLAALAGATLGCQQKAPESAANPATATSVASTPEAALAASLHALRDNNVAALIDNSLPPDAVAKMKADWQKEMQSEPVTEEERKHFAEQMAKLTAPDAEAKMFAEIQPKLAEFDKQSAQQMPMLIAMGQGFARSTIAQNKDLSDAQKKQAEDLLDATAQWAQNTHFTDPALARAAIDVVCKTARALNLKTLDEVRALGYDQAMQKAGIVLGGIKSLLAVYGLDVNKWLDSVKLEAQTSSADAATVNVSYVAFDKPFTTQAEMVRVDGRWFGKHAVEQWRKHQAELATTPAPAAAPAAPPAPDAQ